MATNSTKKQTLKPSSRPQVINSKNLNKPIIIIAMLFSAILLITLAFGLYYHVQNKPEKVLADALVNSFANVAEAAPVASNSVLSFETKGDQPMKFTVVLKTASAGNEGEYDAVLSLNLNKRTYKFRATVITAGNDELYFKVHDLRDSADKFAATSAEAATYRRNLDPFITKVEGKWVQVKSTDIMNMDEQTIQKCAATIGSLELSKNNEKQLKTLFKRHQFIQASETLASEEIRGENSFHYKLRVDPIAVAGFIENALSLDFLEPVTQNCVALYTTQNRQLLEQIKQAVINNPNLISELELWVGKKSRQITKVRINMNNNSTTGNFSSEISFNEKNIEVKIPVESVPLTEISTEINTITGN